MPSKRAVLALLSHDELLALVERFSLPVPDRRKTAFLLDAVASSKRATLPVVLPTLTVPRLRELCQGLGLDDRGLNKEALLAQLCGSAPSAPAVPAPKVNGAKSNGKSVAPPVLEVSLGEKLTREKLEGYLWSAADILRGSIDSSDYKNYILGLLFLKRLSDRFHEEYSELVSVDEADLNEPDEYEFFVPPTARWEHLQKIPSNIGEALNKACSVLEQNNSSLSGVLGGIDFNDERRLGDNRNRDNVLSRLVLHFSKVDLRNANLSEPDLLGRAYEYLIERFADDAGKKGGEFYTPKKVVELLVSLLDPKPGMRICDPTAGSGGMLIACAHYVRDHGGDPKNLGLYGQEKNLGTWALAKMNLLLHNLGAATIEKGDTIRAPKLLDGASLRLFDRVIANPPFSLDDWGREVAEQDPYGRFGYGIPPKSKGDLAFVQHMLATTNHTGMVGVVMPHGVLFRGGAEKEIRQKILQKDLLEAVIGLPTNLFYGTGIPAAILVFNRNKKLDRRKKVLFIEGSRGFKQGTTQNYLRDDDIKKISAAFHSFDELDKFSRVVDLSVIEKNDSTLNISRYVETAQDVETIDVSEAIARLRELEAKRAEAEVIMNAYLKELGYGEK